MVRGEAGPEERLLLVDRPLLRVPQLAIHLDREISTNGLLLNAQQHLSPIWGLGDPTPGGFTAFVADQLDVAPDAVVAWDLMAHDLTPSTILGLDDELVSAPRLDNLCSSWAGVEALVGATADGACPTQIPLLVLFDHEEIGSTSDRGAASTLLPALTERIVLGLGGGREDVLRALAGVGVLQRRQGPRHPPELRRPPRAQPPHRHQRGARAEGEQQRALRHRRRQRRPLRRWRASRPVCRYQRYAHRSDLPCGSTIGPDHGGRASGSPRSTSGLRSWPCTRPGSWAAQPTRRTTRPPWPPSSPPLTSDPPPRPPANRRRRPNELCQTPFVRPNELCQTPFVRSYPRAGQTAVAGQ